MRDWHMSKFIVIGCLLAVVAWFNFLFWWPLLMYSLHYWAR